MVDWWITVPVWQRCKIQQSNSRFPNEKIRFPSEQFFFFLIVIYKSTCLLKTNDRFLLTVMKSTEKLDWWEGLIHACKMKTEWLCAASCRLFLYAIVNWAPYKNSFSFMFMCIYILMNVGEEQWTKSDTLVAALCTARNKELRFSITEGRWLRMGLKFWQLDWAGSGTVFKTTCHCHLVLWELHDQYILQ